MKILKFLHRSFMPHTVRLITGVDVICVACQMSDWSLCLVGLSLNSFGVIAGCTRSPKWTCWSRLDTQPVASKHWRVFTVYHWNDIIKIKDFSGAMGTLGVNKMFARNFNVYRGLYCMLAFVELISFATFQLWVVVWIVNSNVCVCVKSVQVTNASHVMRNSLTVKTRGKVDGDIWKASNTSVYDLMTKQTAEQQQRTKVCTSLSSVSNWHSAVFCISD